MSITQKLVFAIGAAAFGSSFQHGYNTGVVSTPEEIIKDWIMELEESNLMRGVNFQDIREVSDRAILLWSWSASIFCIGGMIGSGLVGFMSDTFGRKGSLLLINLLVFIAAIAQTLAKPMAMYELLLLGRFFIGMNAGLNAGLCPMYLTEISPTHLRGALGTVYQLGITLSILLAYVAGKILGTVDNWPMLFTVTIIPALIQVGSLPFCPESPKYLLIKKKDEASAQKALVWFRDSNDVQAEMSGMVQEANANATEVRIMDFIQLRHLRTPLIIAIMIMLAQQLSGINAIIFYSTSIFISSGLSNEEAKNASIGMGVVNMLMTFVSMVLVEKMGRKTLLLVGFIGMLIVTTILAVCLMNADGNQFVSILAFVLVVVYIIFFASGAGSIPWFLVSELFNQSARGTATSVACATNWIANFIVTLTFPPLKSMFGYFVFFVFSIFQLLFIFFIWIMVPETKNKSIDEITEQFK